MEYLFTRFNGNNQEGLGSILQSQLHLYAYCKINNTKLFCPGLVNISHYQYINKSNEEFNSEINKFINLPSDGDSGTQYVDPYFLIGSWGEVNNQQKQKYIQELFDYIKYDQEKVFNPKKQSLSIHIRNTNPEDVCFNENRELYSDSKKLYFEKLLKNVLNKHGSDTDIHIFSQGNEDDFSFFRNNFDTTLHIEKDIIFTLYHLITSDILITSNSSFSWIAHLYNQNKFVYSRNNFFHSWYTTTTLVDFQGNFI